MSPYFLLT